MEVTFFGSEIKHSQATSIGPLELKNMVLVFITKLCEWNHIHYSKTG